MNTLIPGIIENYDGNTATVRPAMPMQLSSGAVLESPKIVSVPVLWPIADGGQAQMTVPLKSGDDCLLFFSQRAVEDWLSGSNQAPSDPRQFDLTDAFCTPVMRPTVTSADTDNVTIKYSEGTIKIAPDGSLTIDVPETTHTSPTITINASTGINVTAPQTTFTGNVVVNGSITGNGAVAFVGPSVTHNGKQVGDQHKHSGVKSGTSKTGKPV